MDLVRAVSSYFKNYLPEHEVCINLHEIFVALKGTGGPFIWAAALLAKFGPRVNGYGSLLDGNT